LIDVNNPDQNILKKVPYPNIDFLKSGGVETVKVTTSYVKYKNLPKVLPVFNAEATSYFLVKSPADWFYVSGEGYHDKKAFCYSYEANGNTSVIPLADFTNDLGKNKHKFIIFACCSLMDIYFNGVYRDPSLSDATFNNEANPGLHILNDIAKNSNDIIILGYAGTAPGTGSDVNILNNFLKKINYDITDKDFVAKTWLNIHILRNTNFNARAFVKNGQKIYYSDCVKLISNYKSNPASSRGRNPKAAPKRAAAALTRLLDDGPAAGLFQYIPVLSSLAGCSQSFEKKILYYLLKFRTLKSA